MYIELSTILIPLSAALGLSLTVERILEFVSNMWERLLSLGRSKQLPRIKSIIRKVDQLEDQVNRAMYDRQNEEQAEQHRPRSKELNLRLAEEQNLAQRITIKREIEQLQCNTAWDECVDQAITVIEAATDPDDGVTLKRFVLQLLGFATGIILVHYSGVQLFANFLNSLHISVPLPIWLDYTFTGLLIGAGSAPMHTLVRFVTTRKFIVNLKSNPAAAENNFKHATVLKSDTDPVLETWPEFRYHGGVDCETLEHVHLRNTNPDRIILHHTGMHSDSTFEDVVRTIKSRTDFNGNHWLTGYNCIIFADGTIRTFCRWDRHGNHTAGYNRRSLGLAFNGNFESNPQYQGSNANGQFGILAPSEEQIRSGAKIITLWLYLYDQLTLNFDDCIIPHNKLSATACPGNRFPHAKLKNQIHFYFELWKNSVVQQRINEFKLKPYLYV